MSRIFLSPILLQIDGIDSTSSTSDTSMQVWYHIVCDVHLKDKVPSVGNAVELELTSASSGEELDLFQSAVQMLR